MALRLRTRIVHAACEYSHNGWAWEWTRSVVAAGRVSGLLEDAEAQPVLTRELRLAAYVVCIRDGQVLLARFAGADDTFWTLPGGGLDHGEDPAAAAIREAEEETGYDVVIESLLGLDSIRRCFQRNGGIEADQHTLRVIYAARVVAGELRHEVGGSTDQAAWVDLDQVHALDRIDLVDIALELERTRPPLGRVDRDRSRL